MTTAIISDLHLGAWQLNDLLRYPLFIKRLTRALVDVAVAPVADDRSRRVEGVR